MKGLHTIKKAPGSSKRRFRVGRGDSSGIGSYSGRGIKGQRARSGGRSGLIARSMKEYLLRIPKMRGKGFSRQTPRAAIVKLSDLQEHFSDGDRVTPKSLLEKGLVKVAGSRIKILGGGTLEKKLAVVAHAFSGHAKEVIERKGGSAEVIAAPQAALKEATDVR